VPVFTGRTSLGEGPNGTYYRLAIGLESKKSGPIHRNNRWRGLGTREQ
jgi:hypothetical protein